MTKQLKVFRENLEKFAIKHKVKINQNPQFRAQFQQLCSKAGVDPLSSRQGFWEQALGLGDFYYGLVVQAISLCLATRDENGGLVSLNDLHSALERRRGPNQQRISPDDVETAIRKVSSLGSGFRIVKMGAQRMVLSVPCELNVDHSAVIALAKSQQGYVTVGSALNKLGWPRERLVRVLDLMVQESMAWVDDKATGADGRGYWFVCLMEGLGAEDVS